MTTIEKIDSYADLAANWDSYGAAPSDPSLRETAKRLIKRLRPSLGEPQSVVPLNCGGVGFEYNGPPWYVCVCVTKESTI